MNQVSYILRFKVPKKVLLPKNISEAMPYVIPVTQETD